MNKIAFLILGHHDPEQMQRLVYALDDPRFDCYIHIDAAADIASFRFEQYQLRYGNPVILDRRIKVYWGDYTLTRAMILLFEKAYANQENYCRFVVLSGDDYPLVSNETIYQTLTDLSREFIMGHPSEEPDKVLYYHYMRKKNVFQKAISRIVGKLHLKNKNRLMIYGKEQTVYYAPQWFAVSRDCTTYILQAIHDHQKIIDRFFRFSYAPDELLFPTLLFNNETYKEKALRSAFPAGTPYNEKTAIHYINYQRSVKVFTKEDAPALISSGKLFARKLNSGVSDELIDIIDKRRNETEGSALR